MNQKKNNTGKGILCLLGLLIVIAVCGFFAAGTLQKSKLVTDENGATMTWMRRKAKERNCAIVGSFITSFGQQSTDNSQQTLSTASNKM